MITRLRNLTVYVCAFDRTYVGTTLANFLGPGTLAPDQSFIVALCLQRVVVKYNAFQGYSPVIHPFTFYFFIGDFIYSPPRGQGAGLVPNLSSSSIVLPPPPFCRYAIYKTWAPCPSGENDSSCSFSMAPLDVFLFTSLAPSHSQYRNSFHRWGALKKARDDGRFCSHEMLLRRTN
jgi:hypothetical protein